MVKHEMLTRQPELAIRPGPPGGRPVHELPGEVDRCLKKRVVFEVSKSSEVAVLAYGTAGSEEEVDRVGQIVVLDELSGAGRVESLLQWRRMRSNF
jgi:hypothetical protein